MVRVAVVGLGYWGPNLVRTFQSVPGCSVTWICDTDAGRLAAMKARWPLIRGTPEVAEVVGDPQVDAVAVATPISTHFPVARAALENGKHVFIEKPLTDRLETARQLAQLAGRHGRVLMVDHTFVYTPAVRMIKKLIDGGDLGDLLYFDSVRLNLGLFQHDANVVMDLAPHDLAIMDYMLPARPTTVQATGIDHVGSGFEDMAYVTLGFDGAMLAHLHLNWLSPVKIRRILVGGTRKMLIYDDLSPDEKIKVYDKGIQIVTAEDGRKALPLYRLGGLHVPFVEREEALQTATRHFVECVMNGSVPLTGADHALRVTGTLCAAQESLSSGGDKVPLPTGLLVQGPS